MKQDIIKIFNNREKEFYVNICSVSKSGMSRKMRFYIVKKGNLVEITDFIAETAGYKQDKDYALKVNGCGMDMIFSVLYNLQRAMQPRTEYQSKNFNYRRI